MASERITDVIVVGAGPAGSTLAARLSEDVDRTVLLLEAGPDYGADAAAWPADLRDFSSFSPDSHPWGYVHAASVGGRELPLARAKVTGGCSTINACFWLRGSAADYDAWAAAGNPGWDFASLLPYFRRSETDPHGGPLHGDAGPVPVFRVADEELNSVDHAFAEAAGALGFPWVPDANGDPVQQPGIGPLPKNLAAGMRMNAAFTYLAPARSRPNLTIMADTMVDRLTIEDGRVSGVHTVDGRELRGRDVVLCAGAFGSPVILLRSGIGPAAQLAGLGVPVNVDLPGVGRHLLDHPFLWAPETDMRWPLRPETAPGVSSVVPLLLKARSQAAPDEIDLHLYVSQGFDDERGAWMWTVAVSLMNARSRGHVELASPDPAMPPVIDHAYFSDAGDLDALCMGIELSRRLAATDPLAQFLAPDGGFVPPWRGQAELRAWAADRVTTTWHPSGTCRMGPATDRKAVVDHQGRVHGLQGVRVADASVFPGVLRANLHCTVVAVAEKLADTIRHA